MINKRLRFSITNASEYEFESQPKSHIGRNQRNVYRKYESLNRIKNVIKTPRRKKRKDTITIKDISELLQRKNVNEKKVNDGFYSVSSGGDNSLPQINNRNRNLISNFSTFENTKFQERYHLANNRKKISSFVSPVKKKKSAMSLSVSSSNGGNINKFNEEIMELERDLKKLSGIGGDGKSRGNDSFVSEQDFGFSSRERNELLLNSGKRGKNKLGNMSVKQKLNYRIMELQNNDEEFKQLNERIQKYEKKQKLRRRKNGKEKVKEKGKKKKRKKKEDIISVVNKLAKRKEQEEQKEQESGKEKENLEENKKEKENENVGVNLDLEKDSLFSRTVKKSEGKEYFSVRRRKISSAREKKRRRDMEKLRSLEKLEEESVGKFGKAVGVQRANLKEQQLAEKKMKLGYLVVFLARMSVMKFKILEERRKMKKMKKIEQMKRLMNMTIVPFLEKKRKTKWKRSFSNFRNYFIFFRLWSTTKKNKDATMIIKSFLGDTQKALKFVRQVKSFTYNIRSFQNFCKKMFIVKKMRRAILLKIFNVVQAKMIQGISLSDGFKEISNTNSSGNVKRRSSVRRERKNSSRDKETKVNNLSESNKELDSNNHVTKKLLPSQKIKLEIIDEYLRSEDVRVKKEYLLFLKEKEKRKKEKEKEKLNQKIKNVWSNSEEDEQNGNKKEKNQIAKKEEEEIYVKNKPIFNIFIKEKKMKAFVLKAFEIAKEKELSKQKEEEEEEET